MEQTIDGRVTAVRGAVLDVAFDGTALPPIDEALVEAVITAMRGSAAARSREARSRLDGIRAYAAAIGGAIGEALALAPESDPQLHKPQSPAGYVVIVLCAEQGFAGTFNE